MELAGKSSTVPLAYNHGASASKTASRFLAITERYAGVVASGFLRPCSRSCNVLGLMQNARASSTCDIRALVRMRRTSISSGRTYAV